MREYRLFFADLPKIKKIWHFDICVNTGYMLLENSKRCYPCSFFYRILAKLYEK